MRQLGSFFWKLSKDRMMTLRRKVLPSWIARRGTSRDSNLNLVRNVEELLRGNVSIGILTRR